jgi:V8-like Glu-specific endopeptidase
MKQLLLGILLLFTIVAGATTKQVDVIYGKDNRKDVYETTSTQFVELARSAAGMIPHGNIQPLGSNVKINAPDLVSRGICTKEKFSRQISAARCSGFLIGPDLVATAGHCARTPADCKENAWVFDYAITTENQKEIVIPKTSVYKCREIVKSVQDGSTMNDYAVIRLDHKVTDRPVLQFRKEGRPAVGDPLVVIGCPTGIPLKISDGANIRSLNTTYFTANLDTYGGNSGSAVFNTDSGVIEGILVRGETDYVRDPSGCMISNVCADNGCHGEDVTYSNDLAEQLGITK